jgi:hypothetical protein
MFCSECGQPAQGKFCSHCGTPLASVIAVVETTNWETEHRYEVLMRVPDFRATVERHAAMAKKGMTGEEFLQLASKFMTHGVPMDKVAALAQPLYAKWGIGTGKERVEAIDAPVGRVMLRVLCSLARHGQSLRGVKQGTDGCLFEAVLPSDFFSFEGDLLVTVRRPQNDGDAKTRVSAATKIKGQLYDWGKSRKCLDELFANLQLDPG